MTTHKVGQAGFSLLEAMVTVALVGILALGCIKAFDIAADARTATDRLAQRTQLLDLLSNMLRNRAAWGHTIDHDAALQAHVETAVPTATSGRRPITLYDSEGATFVSNSGSYLDADLLPSKALTARWLVKGTWTGRSGNLAEVELQIEAMDRGAVVPGHARRVRHLARRVRDRCRTVAATIPLTSTHGRNGPFQYDRAVVTCPRNHTLVSVNIAPGCGAAWPRARPDLSQPDVGLCYQVSFPRSEWGTMGCAAGNVAGRCEAECCVFD